MFSRREKISKRKVFLRYRRIGNQVIRVISVMSLTLKYLRLRIETSGGLFGVDIPFESGLFVLHADNTSGKSTCLQSIIYALGLEGMMGPSQQVPLPHVATDDLEYNGRTYKVLESEVFLEIANATDIMTVRRQIKGSQSKHVINVWKGSILSQPNVSYGSTDYIVRQSGATRELGFHRLLAEFVGWSLPHVPTYDENEILLYMEAILPLMFVEQKHGWSNLRNRFPTYFKIKDVGRRVFEFLIALDAQKIATQKIILKQQAASIESSWGAKVEECNRIVQSINATIGNLPSKPTAIWPPSIQPIVLIPESNDWIALSQILYALEERLEILALQEIPTVSQVSEASQQELQEKQESLLNAEADLRIKFGEIENQEAQVALLDSRIQSIQKELIRHKDLKKLSSLGAARDLHSASGTCPTCTQSISNSLIIPQGVSEPMTINQNVEFAREQLKMFEAMQQSERVNLDLRKRQLIAAPSLVRYNHKESIVRLNETLFA
jgi:hypothetical protein